MTELKKILMERDGLTSEEADRQIKDCQDDMNERLARGEPTDDILEEHFGLEPDYILDLL